MTYKMVNVGADYETLSSAGVAMVNSDNVTWLWIGRSLGVRLNAVMADRKERT